MSEEKKEFGRNFCAMMQIAAGFRRDYPEMTKEKLTEDGELIFCALAIEEKNVKSV